MDHPSQQLLTGRAYPELARVLRASIEAITRRWEPVVRETLPSADELTFTQIRDDLPKVLEQAAHALESDEPYATRKLEDITQVHAETRFHQGFRLEELITEYSILRPILLDEVTTRLGRSITVDETSALMAAMDLITRQTTLEFVAHQNRQLHAANEAQSKYLSFLSHDLRGGLNGVCLMIEVLRRQLAGEEQFKESVEDLDMMRRSIFETIATMDRFLHAEKFRKGKVQVRPSRVNLRHVLMDVTAQLTYQAKDKGVELQMDAPKESDLVSDKELLLMVLQNVAGNAVKYGAGAAVKLTAAQVDGGAWRLSVSDQGPGIPPEKLSDLFRPFTRGETQGQPGVGLGLTIARQAANMLGAKLWAEPNGAKGTTFHLQLPAEPAR
jgi:signal transduction histidine kinase